MNDWTAVLNFHHLHYFWAVARQGNLTQAARALRVAPSALSSQIRQLEAQLGEALFRRQGRGLVLTEAGRLVLAQADTIFAAGQELEALFSAGRRRTAELRIGAVATLSRNFQESFVRPLLAESEVTLKLVSGSLGELLSQLEAHRLDLVLANEAVERSATHQSRRVARQRVSFVSRTARARFRFGKHLADVPFLLPGPGSAIRRAFDALCVERDVALRVRAEVDDMAMLRLLVRDPRTIAVVPPVVVRDELRSNRLHDLGAVPGVHEEFYAITPIRRFPHPLVEPLVQRRVREILEA
jgi:LysR family transcriptional activator of nhaA